MRYTRHAFMVASMVGLLGCGSDPASLGDGTEQQEQAFIIPVQRLAPPRLLSPLSTAAITSRATPLRWQLPSGEQGGLVQICRDRECHAVEALALTLGGALRSLPALRPGVHFWRVYGFHGIFRSARPSATWEFRMGPRSAGVASSHGHAADYNGDGYSDLAIPASEVGGPVAQVFVYHGSHAGLHAHPDRVLSGPAIGVQSLQWAVSSTDLDAGDLNGDGYSDMVVRARQTDAPSVDGVVTRVLVYYGGPTGLPTEPSRVLPAASTPGSEHGFSFSAAGDLDGDGYGDLTVGDISVPEQFDDNAGFVHVYRGGAGGVAETPDLTLAQPFRERLFGWALGGGGDFNADGFSDLLVTEPMRSFGPGAFRVFPGSATGLSWDTVVTTPNPDTRAGTAKLGQGAAMAGDINGDGYSDVIVSQRGYSIPVDGHPTVFAGPRFLVYFGGASGLSATAAQALGTTPTESSFLVAAAAGGDVNGDGYSDLAAPTSTGEIQVFLGGPSGYAPAAVATIPSFGDPTSNSYLSFLSASITHDFNRDGYSDVYSRGRVFRGGASGPSTTASVTLTAP